MKKLSQLKLNPLERKAISAFSRRLKKSLGKQLVTVQLFGSKARGNSKKSSDVDIYIIVKEKSLKILDKVSEIDADVWDEFDVLLSPVVYSVYEEKKNLEMHSFFFEAVQKEGIPI
ncbi:MAG: nucleotidyltransferase domain-containing protein [Ignavibacteriales bacterium]|nr:nucleotidyltransferase domain-containing protein [Ignavibacteriales bacterium]